ncbi:MAG: glutaredoxin domain-containing protein [Sulfurifustaceae bacterium]
MSEYRAQNGRTVPRALLVAALLLALVLLALDRYAAFAHVPGPDSRRVVIYTTAWCPYCKRLRGDLDASGVPYIEYDVEKTFEGQLGYWALRARGVPVSAIGGSVVRGYQVPEIEQALGRLGYRFHPTADARSPLRPLK